MRSIDTHVRGLVGAFIIALSGCFRSLPPPTVREVVLPPKDSYEKLCASGLKRAEIIIHEESPLSGILECGADQAVIALFNSLQVRVRTITISRAGVLRDEITFLSSNDDSVELLISEIETALGSSATEPRGDRPRLSVMTREPPRVARRRSATPHPAPLEPKMDRN